MVSRSIQPFGHNSRRPELGAVLIYGRGAGKPSNTMLPWPWPTSMPTFILMRKTVWPQYTNVTYRLDRQTDMTTIRQHYMANRFASGRPKTAVYTQCLRRRHKNRKNHNKSSAVAEMGDRGHNRHGPKRGGCFAPFAERWEPV